MNEPDKNQILNSSLPETIVSGGQTGVDRAALDAAIACGLPITGWCPRGRRSEDGVIPAEYDLRETASRNYAVRTEWNIRDSDGTLIIAMGQLSGGTRLTWQLAGKHGKPRQVVHLRESPGQLPFSDQNSVTDQCSAVVEWIQANRIRVLNVAGPRGSSHPKIYAEAKDFVRAVLQSQESGSSDDSVERHQT